LTLAQRRLANAYLAKLDSKDATEGLTPAETRFYNATVEALRQDAAERDEVIAIDEATVGQLTLA
jgi:hypothetical protein